MPREFLNVTLLDLRANLEQMRRTTVALNDLTSDSNRTHQASTTMNEHLRELRRMNELNTELLFAVDSGLTALSVSNDASAL